VGDIQGDVVNGEVTAEMRHREVFKVDEDRAVAALELAWADGGLPRLLRRWRHLVGDQQRRRRAHGRHAGRANPEDPRGLAGDAVTPGNRAAFSA
jgi:hypothetical protein